MLALDPPLAGSQGAIGGAVQDNVDDRVECARRQRLCARDEIARRVVDETVQGTIPPDLLEHCLDFVGETDVANEIGGLTAALRPLRHRPSKDLLASPANHDLRAKPEKTGP